MSKKHVSRKTARRPTCPEAVLSIWDELSCQMYTAPLSHSTTMKSSSGSHLTRCQAPRGEQRTRRPKREDEIDKASTSFVRLYRNGMSMPRHAKGT